MTTDHTHAAAFLDHMAVHGDRCEEDRALASRLEQAEDRVTRFANLAAALAILRHDREMPERLRVRMAGLVNGRIDGDVLDLAARLDVAERQLTELDAEVVRLREENAVLVDALALDESDDETALGVPA